MSDQGNLKEIIEGQVFIKNQKIQIRDKARKKYLLYNITNQRNLIIDETGKLIWELCDGKKTVDDIINYIKNNYYLAKGTNDKIEEIIKKFIKVLFLTELLICKDKIEK